jgi:hypothetical protein
MSRSRILGAAVLVVMMGACLVLGEDSAQPSFNVAFAVRAVANLAEAYIGGLAESMATLTTTDELRSGDWNEMQDLLAQFQDATLTYDAWFLLPDGSYYKVGSGLQSANLSDRAYFSRVMAGEATMGDLVVSRSTGRKSMILTAPILVDGAVIGALGVTLYLEEFSLFLDDLLRLPVEIGFYATNSDGIIALHSNPSFLMEEGSRSGIAMATGGIQISSALGLTFVLGTVSDSGS